MIPYFVTTTDDYETLYGQSLADGLNNRFTSAIGTFSDTQNVYLEQTTHDGIDNHYLIDVEEF